MTFPKIAEVPLAYWMYRRFIRYRHPQPKRTERVPENRILTQAGSHRPGSADTPEITFSQKHGFADAGDPAEMLGRQEPSRPKAVEHRAFELSHEIERPRRNRNCPNNPD